MVRKYFSKFVLLVALVIIIFRNRLSGYLNFVPAKISYIIVATVFAFLAIFPWQYYRWWSWVPNKKAPKGGIYAFSFLGLLSNRGQKVYIVIFRLVSISVAALFFYLAFTE